MNPKFFELDGNCYVAYDIESCAKFINSRYQINIKDKYPTYEDILTSLKETDKNMRLYGFSMNEMDILGFKEGTYARFDSIAIEDIYKLFHKSEKNLPIQIVYKY